MENGGSMGWVGGTLPKHVEDGREREGDGEGEGGLPCGGTG